MAIATAAFGLRKRATDTSSYEERLSEARDFLRSEVDQELAFVSPDHLPLVKTAFDVVAGLGRIYPGPSAGNLDTIARFYRDTPPSGQYQRLLVQGRAGSGKSVALRVLQARLLQATDDVFHPVYVSLAAWDGEEDFVGWLTSSVALYISPQFAQQLLNDPQTVLLLDGLDEVDRDDDASAPEVGPIRAAKVLEYLSNLPLACVVTCRTLRVNQLLESGALFAGAPTIELRELSREQFATYVSGASANEKQLGQAAEIIDLTDQFPDFQAVLTSPLFARLAVDLLRNQLGAAVIECAPSNESAIHDSLFDGLLRLAQLRLKRTRRRYRDSPNQRLVTSPGARYRLADLYRWYQTLAQYLSDFAGAAIAGVRVPSGLLAPHQLWPSVGPERVRRAARLLTAVMWLPLVTGLVWVVVSGRTSRAAGLVVFLSAAGLFTVSLVILENGSRPFLIAPARLRHGAAWIRLVVGGVVAAAALVSVPFGRSGFALATAAGVVLSFGLGYSVAVRPDVSATTVLGTGAAVVAVLQIPATVLVPSDNLSAALASGAVEGIVALVSAVTSDIFLARRLGAPRGFTELPLNFLAGGSPYFRLDGDGVTAAVVAVIASSLTAVALHAGALRVTICQGSLLSISAGIAAGPGMSCVAARRYWAMLIVARHRLPIRLRHFLEWSYRSGVLRRSTATYYFRHARLAEYLRLSHETAS